MRAAASRRRPSASAPTSTRCSSLGSPRPAAATSTSSRAPRRSPSSSPARWARRSPSPRATSCSSSRRGRAPSSTSLNEFPCSRAGDAWRVELGSLFSGQTIDPVVRVAFPAGENGHVREVKVRVEDRDGAFAGASVGVAFTYAGHEENDRQERDRVVDRRVAFLYAAQARRRALELNRAGEPRRRVPSCAIASSACRRYAGDDPELQVIVRDLERRLTTPRHMDSPVAEDEALLHGRHITSRSRDGREVPSRTWRPAPARLVVLARPSSSPSCGPPLAHLAAASPSLFGAVPFAVIGATPDGDATALAAAEVDLVDRATAPLCRRRAPDRLHAPPPRRQLVLALARAAEDGGRLDGRLGRDGLQRPSRGVRRVRDRPSLAAAPRPAYTPEALLHEETRGCLFDFCESRLDVETKLRAGRVCEACGRALAAAGLQRLSSSTSSTRSGGSPPRRRWCTDAVTRPSGGPARDPGRSHVDLTRLAVSAAPARATLAECRPQLSQVRAPHRQHPVHRRLERNLPVVLGVPPPDLGDVVRGSPHGSGVPARARTRRPPPSAPRATACPAAPAPTVAAPASSRRSPPASRCRPRRPPVADRARDAAEPVRSRLPRRVDATNRCQGKRAVVDGQ